MLEPIVNPAALGLFPWFERFYGDGSPHFQVGRDDRPAPNAIDAATEAKRAIKRLRKVARRDSEAAPALLALAEQIEECRRGHRCLSGACPKCQRARQRWLVWTLAVMKPHLGEPVGILSLIPATAIKIGDRASIRKVLHAKSEFIANAEEVGISLAVGALDFSFNEHAKGRFPSYLQPHFWVIGRLSELRQCRAKLVKLYPRSHTVYASVRVWVWDGDLRALAYAFKWRFTRRVTLPRARHKTGRTIRRQNTRNRPLRLAQHVHLAALLHDLGLDHRLVLHGVRIRPNARNRPVIRPIPE